MNTFLVVYAACSVLFLTSAVIQMGTQGKDFDLELFFILTVLSVIWPFFIVYAIAFLIGERGRVK